MGKSNVNIFLKYIHSVKLNPFIYVENENIICSVSIYTNKAKGPCFNLQWSAKGILHKEIF